MIYLLQVVRVHHFVYDRVSLFMYYVSSGGFNVRSTCKLQRCRLYTRSNSIALLVFVSAYQKKEHGERLMEIGHVLLFSIDTRRADCIVPIDGGRHRTSDTVSATTMSFILK